MAKGNEQALRQFEVRLKCTVIAFVIVEAYDEQDAMSRVDSDEPCEDGIRYDSITDFDVTDARLCE